MMAKRIFITGVPLSGKTTICGVLKGFHDFKHISTGSVARTVQKLFKYDINGDNTDTFAEHIIRYAVDDFIKNNKADEIVIDGFPRNESQIKFIDKNIMKNMNYKVVILTLSDESIEERARSRGRADDSMELVKHRAKMFPLENMLKYLELNGIEHKVFDMGAPTALEDVKQYIGVK
jgi:adenylate kinase family enzyme